MWNHGKVNIVASITQRLVLVLLLIAHSGNHRFSSFGGGGGDGDGSVGFVIAEGRVKPPYTERETNL